MPTSCDSCAKPLWGAFRPPPALECKRCRAKFHKEHITMVSASAGGNPGGEGVTPCKVGYDPTNSKEMLLMAPTPDMQQMWVSRLGKKIEKSGYKASMMNDNVGGGSSRSNEPMRSASQRSTGGPPSLTTTSGPKSATLPSKSWKKKWRIIITIFVMSHTYSYNI